MADGLSRAKVARAAARLNRRSGSGLPALVLMTDDERMPNAAASVAALPTGSMVIVRSRTATHRAMLAGLLLPIARARRLVLLIADDPELAQHVEADGAHFPEQQLRHLSRWRTRRPDWVITAAVHALSTCAAAKRSGADALLLSPVLATQSHPNASHLGATRALMIARQAPLPVYALGGITPTNASRLAAPFAGIAAVGALRA